MRVFLFHISLCVAVPNAAPQTSTTRVISERERPPQTEDEWRRWITYIEKCCESQGKAVSASVIGIQELPK